MPAMIRLEDMTEPELGFMMTQMASAIEVVAKVLGVEKPHFCLVVFNDPKVAQYIANCERADIIKSMRETADRLERRQDVPRGIIA